MSCEAKRDGGLRYPLKAEACVYYEADLGPFQGIKTS